MTTAAATAASTAVATMLRRFDVTVTPATGGDVHVVAAPSQTATVAATLDAFGFTPAQDGDTFTVPAAQLV